MAYKWDVFLSYNSKPLHSEWVNEIFFELFEAYLSEELNKDVRIFRFNKEIHGGDDWELRIKKELIHSKIMVSVCSSAYFRSEWCIKEFAFMDYRQRNSGCMTIENPSGLVIPIKIFDGEHFSNYINTFQMFDCVDYNLRAAAFKYTPKYVEFEIKLRGWVKDIALAYNRAPAWNDDWRHPDWITKAWVDLSKFESVTSKTPPTL